jgi:hypothetical protein
VPSIGSFSGELSSSEQVNFRIASTTNPNIAYSMCGLLTGSIPLVLCWQDLLKLSHTSCPGPGHSRSRGFWRGHGSQRKPIKHSYNPTRLTSAARTLKNGQEKPGLRFPSYRGLPMSQSDKTNRPCGNSIVVESTEHVTESRPLDESKGSL